MPATFSRLTDWVTQVLSSAALNAEFNNILDNLDPTGVGDYSTTVAQMQIQTSPGGLGSESLATALGGELERLRYVLARIIGTSVQYWYQAPPSSISSLVSSLGGSGVPPNRIVAGLTSGNSSQLVALVPGAGTGTAAAVVVAGGTTPLSYVINGNPYTIATNITVSLGALAPSTNNTFMLNNTAASGQQWTKFSGMYGTQIPFTAAGTGISALVGQFAGFQHSSGEYLLGFVGTAALTNVWRGAFFGSGSTGIAADPLTASDTFALMKLSWLFATTAASVAITYDNPTISGTQPVSASPGDYWLNLATTAWMTFSGSWQTASATLIGICLQNTAQCVAARTFDSYISPSAQNDIQLQWNSTSQVNGFGSQGAVRIFGTSLNFSDTKPLWDFTQNLEASTTLAASTYHYFYMKESGATVVSDKAPLKRNDLFGLYHPWETWRCLGNAHLNASTQYETSVRSFLGGEVKENVLMGDWHAYDMHNVVQFGTNTTIPYTTNTVAMTFPTNSSRFQVAISDPNNFPTSWPATATWTSIATLSLTPGLWRMNSSLFCPNTNTSVFQTIIKTTIDPNVSAATLLYGYNAAAVTLNGLGNGSTVPENATLVIPAYFAQVTASTNYLMNIRIDGPNNATVGMAGYQWYFLAERIDDLVGNPS